MTIQTTRSLTIDDCKNRRWDQLSITIEKPCLDVYLKIVVRAVFETHGKGSPYLCDLGENLLERSFSKRSISDGLLHLDDFVEAHKIAKAEFKDIRIAQQITDYVQSKIAIFKLIFTSDNVSQEVKDKCLKYFPFFKKEIEQPRVTLKRSYSSSSESSSDNNFDANEILKAMDETGKPRYKAPFPNPKPSVTINVAEAEEAAESENVDEAADTDEGEIDGAADESTEDDQPLSVFLGLFESDEE